MKNIMVEDGTTGQVEDVEAVVGETASFTIYPDGNGDAVEVEGVIVEVFD